VLFLFQNDLFFYYENDPFSKFLLETIVLLNDRLVDQWFDFFVSSLSKMKVFKSIISFSVYYLVVKETKQMFYKKVKTAHS